MSGSGVLIFTMKIDMETIAFSEEDALQVKKEPVVLLQGERVFRNLELMIWDLELQKIAWRELSEIKL